MVFLFGIKITNPIIHLNIEWPQACNAPNSSPIEIDLDKDGPFERINSSIKFHNYDAKVSLVAENNGHGGKNVTVNFDLW